MVLPTQPYGTSAPTTESPASAAPDGLVTERPATVSSSNEVEEWRYREARKRLKARRDWQGGMLAYVVVNAFLVGIWAMTGRGYFWPAWVIGGWGLGMVLGFWDVYVRKPISEADVEQEMRRG